MAKKSINLESQSVTIETEAGQVVFNLSQCSPDMIVKLALHGASQKIGDSYASAKSATENTDMSVDEYALAQATAVVGNLYNDDWTVRSGEGAPRVTDLAVALSTVKGITVEEAVDIVNNCDDDTKKKLRAHPAIKAELDRIRAERAAAKAAESAKGADSDLDLELPV